MSQVQNIVIVGGTSFLPPVSYEANKPASCAGHTLANTLVPLLPSTHRIILIDASAYSYYPVAALRGAVVPGWEEKITVPLTTENVFGKSSPHQVVAPNKVVELKEGSLVLEKDFEGSTELPFFVCRPLKYKLDALMIEMRTCYWYCSAIPHARGCYSLARRG
jgi:hypothetical protein